MNHSELLAVLKTKVSEVKEIPPPPVPENLPAHELKPYRDVLLFVTCLPEKWLALAEVIKQDERLDCDFLVMATAVDYAKTTATETTRIDAVYHFYSFKHKHKLVVKVSLPRENPSISSVIHLWPTADWQEREVYDMFGVKFEGHPNCTRILMWDGFPGWPLRKDFVHVPDRYDD